MPEWRKLLVAALVFVTIIGTWLAVSKVIQRYARLPDAAGGPCALWFVGSSTMHKWSTLQTDLSPWNAYNRGVDGATIQAITQMFVNETGPAKPRAFIFYLGDNDIAWGESPDDVLKQLDAIIATKRARYGATPMFVISIKPSPARLDFLPEQRSFNRRAASIAAQADDITFIDVANQFLVNGRPGDFYAPDGVHLSTPGYDILTRGVQATINEKLPGSDRSMCERRSA